MSRDSLRSHIIDALFGDIPSAIDPIYITENANSPIELYRGLINISTPDVSFQEEASVIFEWTPRIQIIANLSSENVLWPDWTIRQLNLSVTIPELDISTDAYILSSQHKERYDVSLKLGLCETRSTDHCSSMTFQLVNFIDFIGEPIKFAYYACTGRTELLTDQWHIILDNTPHKIELMRELVDSGGFGITHTGLLKRRDSSEYSIDEGLDTLDALRWFLSFCKGRYVGIPFIHEVKNENQVYKQWMPAITSPWKYSPSWYPEREIVDLSDAFTTFLHLWSDPIWKDTLKFIIHWYIIANENITDTEGSIVLTQIALERLAWMVLVNERKVISSCKFKKLHAGANFNLLFDELGITLNIPDDLKELSTYCKENDIDNIASCFVGIRNSIVHPPKKITDTISYDTVYQALQTSIWSLELSILSLLGYKGNYASRVNEDTEWKGESEIVQWDFAI